MFKRSEVHSLSYQCLPLNPSMILFPRKRVTKVVERLVAQAAQKGGTQWPSKTRWFSMSQMLFLWPMGKGQTNFLPDKKTGSPRIEKLVSNYKKCWIWGGCIYVQKLKRRNWHVLIWIWIIWYDMFTEHDFPIQKSLNGPWWCVTSTVDQGELVSKFSTGWG
jgi:hypothetical protein